LRFQKILLHSLPLGDIYHQTTGFLRPAFSISEHPDVIPEPDHTPIGGNGPVLQFVIATGRYGGLAAGYDRLTIIRMNKRCPEPRLR
jgi:hypothetical protein